MLHQTTMVSSLRAPVWRQLKLAPHGQWMEGGRHWWGECCQMCCIMSKRTCVPVLRCRQRPECSDCFKLSPPNFSAKLFWTSCPLVRTKVKMSGLIIRYRGQCVTEKVWFNNQCLMSLKAKMDSGWNTRFCCCLFVLLRTQRFQNFK